VGVAFFPTPPSGSTAIAGKLHDGFAISLFLLRIVISIFRIPVKREIGAKMLTDQVQITYGQLMLGRVLAVGLYYITR